MLTARPAAMRTFSDSIVSVLPPTSSSRVTLSFETVAFFTLAPAYTVIPLFLKLFVTVSEDSGSSIGRIRGSASIRVTLVPNAVKMSANSHPPRRLLQW